ncbi:histidine kinase [Halobacteriales archaeon SW_6_65_15]|nr:MAG: histidine kinase [Halobacteriales archaeon SW_6_65_15]
MSQKPSREPGARETLGLESGLEALRSSPAFRGPIEPLDAHDSNDHLALIYESREEQFAAAIPFMRQGLERGERCMYIADENSREEVLDAMREADVDVDSAVESGALTLHTKQDTYCRNGAFDPDDMIEFLRDAIERASEEYKALRVAGEMTWIFGDEPSVTDLVEYEGKLNDLLPRENGIALCQYNRNRFPPEVLRDVIRTHPHLVYDNTVSHNCYYTPPEEFFGPDRPAHEVDRLLNTLRDRTEATVELTERERALQRQNDRLESFASMLAHELRNPLNIAQIYSQSAMEGDRDAAEEVATALDRIEEMINVMLITARGSDLDIDRQSVSLREAATRVWDDLTAGPKTLVVETDRTVRADPVHVRHLLENLFRNAVEHGSTSPPSEAREDAVERGSTSSRPGTDESIEHGSSNRDHASIDATESDSAADLKTDGGDGVTVRVGDLPSGFYVEDDGSGISEAVRETVFEAGYSTDSKGVGLGLTFVAQLVETYGWEYDVTESEAGGARFEFRGVDFS